MYLYTYYRIIYIVSQSLYILPIFKLGSIKTCRILHYSSALYPNYLPNCLSTNYSSAIYLSVLQPDGWACSRAAFPLSARQQFVSSISG